MFARRPGAPSRSPHALHERRDGARRVRLEHEVQVADVDPELQGRGADDAGVRPVSEPLLGGPALLHRDRAVVNEHVDARAPHLLGDGLRERPRLAEEEALLSRGPRARPRARSPADRSRSRPDEAARACRAFGGSTTTLVALGDPCEPARGSGPGCRPSRSGRSRCTSCLDERRKPLEHAHQVRAAVRAGERVNLVDDDDRRSSKSLCDRDARRHEHHLERLGGRHQELGGLSYERHASRGPAASPCQTNRRSPTISVYVAEALLLVVEQRLDGGDVDGAHAVGGSSSTRPASAGNIDASVLPPAVGASTTAFLPSRIASPASSCTGRSDVHPSRETIAS